MTVIVGLAADGGVYLGYDSAWTSGSTLDLSPYEKAFTVELADGQPVGFGVAGSPRIGQVIRYTVDWSTMAVPEAGDEERWLVAIVIPVLRRVLDEHGAPKDEDKDGTTASNMLVAVNGRIFGVFDEWEARQVAERFDVVGSGGAEAVGALHALDAVPLQHFTAGMRVEQALATSERYNSDVSRPFGVLFVPAGCPQ